VIVIVIVILNRVRTDKKMNYVEAKDEKDKRRMSSKTQQCNVAMLQCCNPAAQQNSTSVRCHCKHVQLADCLALTSQETAAVRTLVLIWPLNRHIRNALQR
jgi:hypothetical protein